MTATPSPHQDLDKAEFVPEFLHYYGTPRHALIDLLSGLQPRSVLEVGCGMGANLAEIRRRCPGCRTTGVEVMSQAASLAGAAAGIDQLVHGDVMDPTSVDFAPGSFDLIVLSHVLEHFAWPERVVERCLRWLDADGVLLIALPNVRHMTVLKELLFDGDFRYRACGVLDRTHLRFFTRRSAIRFLEGQGLKVIAVRPDIDGRRSLWLNRLSLGLARDFTAFAYNFLVARQ